MCELCESSNIQTPEAKEELDIAELVETEYLRWLAFAGRASCIFRGKAITSPKSSRSAVRSDGDHGSELMPIRNSI